jgi:serpin B
MNPRLTGWVFVAFLPLTAFAANFDAAASTNALGLELYRQVGAEQPGNLVLSPYSIETALAMVYAGAAGETRQQMADALHWAIDDDAAQTGFSQLRTAIDAAMDRSTAAGAEWHIANRLFAERRYEFRDSFFATLRDHYGADLERVDFRDGAEASRQTINHWVEQQTHARIQSLLPAESIKPNTRLALINALYLNAKWQDPFKKKNTRDRAFHATAASSHRVPTMEQTSWFGYAHEQNVTVVSLDYVGDQLQCLILLPDQGVSLDTFVSKLQPADFARWAKLREHRSEIALYLPKFRLAGTTLPLGSALRTLGIKSAFDEPRGSANFDRIAPRKPDDYLALDDVYHQAFVLLDEEGTEVAAATGGLVLGTFGVTESKPIEVHVDRPFVFAIQDHRTGTCLFLGRIANPGP